MRTASARARIEAEGVHGDGAKSRTRHEKQIRCLAEWIPLGKRRADSGPCRALIARRPRELHEADPGHGPRRRATPQGRRAFGRCGRRGGPLEGCPPNSRAVDQDQEVPLTTLCSACAQAAARQQPTLKTSAPKKHVQDALARSREPSQREHTAGDGTGIHLPASRPAPRVFP